jgi:hypothetical protein
MDSYRRSKISDLGIKKELEGSDIVVFSRDVENDKTYDNTHTITADDLFKAIRKNIKYWSTYDYNYDDKSLNIWSEEDVFEVSVNGFVVQISTSSPTTDFALSPGGTILDIKG